MASLTINQLVKIILGIVVVVAVVLGIYFVFKDRIINFFEGLPTNSSKFILGLLK